MEDDGDEEVDFFDIILDPSDPYESIITGEIAKSYQIEGSSSIFKNQLAIPTPDYSKATPLTKLDIDSTFTSKQIEHLIKSSIIKKMKGLVTISQKLFGSSNIDKIRSKIPVEDESVKTIKHLEMHQARSFWTLVSHYLKKRGINFEKRIKQADYLDKVDIVNFRLNVVGNILRNEFINNIGFGDYIFRQVSVHQEISSLDLSEPVRPVLYFLVIRTYSAPLYLVSDFARELIIDYIQYLEQKIGTIFSNINFHPNYAIYRKVEEVVEFIHEHGILNWKPNPYKKVTDTQVMDEYIYFTHQGPDEELGEKIHFELLKDYPQISYIPSPSFFRMNSTSSIFAEFPAGSADGSIAGRLDLVIFDRYNPKTFSDERIADILLIIELKTYSDLSLKQIFLPSNYKEQVDTYATHLSQQSLSLNNTIRSVIFVNRKHPDIDLTSILHGLLRYETQQQIRSGHTYSYTHVESQVKVFAWR